MSKKYAVLGAIIFVLSFSSVSAQTLNQPSVSSSIDTQISNPNVLPPSSITPDEAKRIESFIGIISTLNDQKNLYRNIAVTEGGVIILLLIALKRRNRK